MVETASSRIGARQRIPDYKMNFSTWRGRQSSGVQSSGVRNQIRRRIMKLQKIRSTAYLLQIHLSIGPALEK